jgi:hypothetical protein
MFECEAMNPQLLIDDVLFGAISPFLGTKSRAALFGTCKRWRRMWYQTEQSLTLRGHSPANQPTWVTKFKLIQKLDFSHSEALQVQMSYSH